MQGPGPGGMPPGPPTQAVGLWSKYQPPPPNRKPGWTGPTQGNQVVGQGPGAATPPVMK